MAARRQPAAAGADRRRNDRTARRPVGASVPAAAESAAARVRTARGPGRRPVAFRAHTHRHLGAGVRVRARHGDRLRRSGCRPLHGRRPVAARRHRAGPAGGRIRCRRVRPRPAGQLSGVVTEIRLSRPRRLPRLSHLRPPHRPQAGPRHRSQRALGCQGAVRPAARRPCGRRARRRLRRGGAPTAHRRERAHRPARARGRGLRHRVVRPLVVRGAGVAGAGAAGTAGRPASASARCPTPSPTDSSAHRSNCRPALGVRARTGRCGPASGWPIWCS